MPMRGLATSSRNDTFTHDTELFQFFSHSVYSPNSIRITSKATRLNPLLSGKVSVLLKFDKTNLWLPCKADRNK